MTICFWKSLLVSPIVFVVILAICDNALAKQITKKNEITTSNYVQTSQQIVIAAKTQADDSMAQVTSVSQLSDVQPTDWAFQALQSLVERYGCVAGYPDRTFRGNRAMTRYEFAAGLNACLNRINQLLASSTANFATKEDLAKLQKLQEQFAPELTTLRSRIDNLEAHSAQLEAHQFSTTTQLNGEVVVGVAGVVSGKNANGDKIDRNTIIGDRVRLNLNTSFTGEDLLTTRLQASNLDGFSDTATKTPEGDFRFAAGNTNNQVAIDALLYQFPLDKKTGVVIEANNGAIDDFTNTVNPLLDGDGGSGALTNFGTRNPIYYYLNGTGLGIRHQFSKNLELSLGYLVNGTANDPQKSNGLFNGNYGALAQLTIKPSDSLTLGLTYVNAYNTDFTANGSSGTTRANVFSYLGPDARVSTNSYGVEASYQVTPAFVISGWGGLTKARSLSTPTHTTPVGDLNIWNYAVTLAFPDFGRKGNLAGVIFGMEPTVTSVSSSLKNADLKDKDTSLHIEGFYQYKVSDNISITPGLVWLTNLDGNSANGDTVIGTVRTTFTF